MYLWLAAAAVVLILVPLPDPGFGPFTSTTDAGNFLRTLWQVDAAALALSLTIIVFAVQAYRCQGSREFLRCDHGNSPPGGRPVRAGRSAWMASRWRRIR